MATLTHATRSRTVGSTTAFATGGTAVGGALALVLNELFALPLSESGVMALGMLLSAVGAVLGGWLAPSKKAETEAYLGSVLAMARYGDHGRLTSAPAQAPDTSADYPSVSEPQPQAAAPVPEPTPVMVDTAGTEFTDPAYATAK